jgi:hypothetical protein
LESPKTFFDNIFGSVIQDSEFIDEEYNLFGAPSILMEIFQEVKRSLHDSFRARWESIQGSGVVYYQAERPPELPGAFVVSYAGFKGHTQWAAGQ